MLNPARRNSDLGTVLLSLSKGHLRWCCPVHLTSSSTRSRCITLQRSLGISDLTISAASVLNTGTIGSGSKRSFAVYSADVYLKPARLFRRQNRVFLVDKVNALQRYSDRSSVTKTVNMSNLRTLGEYPSLATAANSEYGTKGTSASSGGEYQQQDRKPS